MKAMCIQAINHCLALCHKEKIPAGRIPEWQCLAGMEAGTVKIKVKSTDRFHLDMEKEERQ